MFIDAIFYNKVEEKWFELRMNCKNSVYSAIQKSRMPCFSAGEVVSFVWLFCYNLIPSFIWMTILLSDYWVTLFCSQWRSQIPNFGWFVWRWLLPFKAIPDWCAIMFFQWSTRIEFSAEMANCAWAGIWTVILAGPGLGFCRSWGWGAGIHLFKNWLLGFGQDYIDVKSVMLCTTYI